MQFTFLSAHSVHGIVLKPDAADLVLYDDPKAGLRVTVTANLNQHLHVVNRQHALIPMILRSMIGEPLGDTFDRNLAEHLARIETKRIDAAGTDGVVVVQVTGDVIASIPGNARSIKDFILCFDAFDKKALSSRLLPHISAVLTALRLGGSRRYEFRSLAEGSYLTTADGVIVHSFSIENSAAGVYVSSPLNDAQVEQIARDIPLILKANTLERIVRLFAHSLNRETDNYRSFIAAWSALEILIGKIFSTYQPLLAAELRKVSQPTGVQVYLNRVVEVMEDNHNLADKFSVLSMFLNDEGQPDEEVEKFRRLKKIRDRLFHGEEISDESLPTGEVQQLFEKYLRNHVRRDA
jgi:hypothetical protein